MKHSERTSRAVVLLATVFVVSTEGCSGPFAPNLDANVVRVETNNLSYAAGDTVRVTLTNDSRRDLGYSFCGGFQLERLSGSTWVAAEELARRVCTLELTVLGPNRSTTGRLLLRFDLAPGTYRYRARVWSVDAPPAARDIEETSNRFEVTR